MFKIQYFKHCQEYDNSQCNSVNNVINTNKAKNTIHLRLRNQIHAIPIKFPLT